MGQRAVVDRVHVQQVELDLVGRQRPLHEAVEQIELRGRIVRNARGPDLAFPQQLIEAAGRVVGAGQPVGPMDQEQFDVIGAEQAERFLQALDHPRAAGVVVGRVAIGVIFARHVDAGLGDDFQLVASPGERAKASPNARSTSYSP